MKSPAVIFKESPQVVHKATPKNEGVERSKSKDKYDISKSKDKDELNNFLLNQKPSDDNNKVDTLKPTKSQ